MFEGKRILIDWHHPDYPEVIYVYCGNDDVDYVLKIGMELDRKIQG